jgi:hypothetical protein
MENPYTSPQADTRVTPLDDSSADPVVLRLARIGEVAVAWENLRLRYNIVLAVVALVAVLNINAELLADSRAMAAMLLAALAANACFCVGPLFEGYVTWFFGPVSWLRMVVFVVGMMGAVALTMGVVVMVSWEGPV